MHQHKVVPREPTERMLRAGQDWFQGLPQELVRIYQAMVTAAPIRPYKPAAWLITSVDGGDVVTTNTELVTDVRQQNPERVIPLYTELVPEKDNLYPHVGSTWRHHISKQLYTVVHITNESTIYPDKYPVTVVYKGTKGLLWSRPIEDWYRSFHKEE